MTTDLNRHIDDTLRRAYADASLADTPDRLIRVIELLRGKEKRPEGLRGE